VTRPVSGFYESAVRNSMARPADDTVRRLIDEHWRAMAVAAVRRDRNTDPQGWADYLAEAEEFASADARIADEWGGGSG